MTSHVSWINNTENIEIWIKSWKEINHWLGLKIESMKNSSNELKKIDKKTASWKLCKTVRINF